MIENFKILDNEFEKILEIKAPQDMFEAFKNFCFKYPKELKLMEVLNPAYFALPIQVKEHKFYNNRWNATEYHIAINLSVVRKILKENMPLVFKPSPYKEN
jgi:hypothetical protein